jgi:uncharacterized protein (TIGR02996 family)
MLADVLASPEDEGLRRVCADWLEDHGDPTRADFIRTQLELAHLPPSSPRRAELEDREDDLLVEHEERWLGPLPEALFEWRFHGGFVDEVVLMGQPWLDGCEALFVAHPAGRVDFRGANNLLEGLGRSPLLTRLRCLTFTLSPSGPVFDLLRRPEMAELTGIRFTERRLFPRDADHLLPALASRPGAGRLRELYLEALTPGGLAAFLAEPALAGVTAFGLGSFPEGRESELYEALLGQAARWTALELPVAPAGPRVLARLAELTSLRELSLRWPKGPVEGLALPAGLERLTIFNSALRPHHLAGLASQPCLPNLHYLRLPLSNHSPESEPTDRELVPALAGVLARLSGPVLHLELGGRLSRPLATLVGLPGADKVRSLDLEEARLPNADFKALAESDRLSGLRALHFSNAAATARRVALLSGAPILAGLRELHFFAGRIDPEALRVLLRPPGLPGLRSLEVGSAGLEADAVAVLRDWAGLSRLRYLGLAYNRLDRAAVEPLWRPGALSPLARLNLYHNQRGRALLRREDLPPAVVSRFGGRLRT